MGYLSTGTGLLDDGVWLGDSTPVECGRSRQAVHGLGHGRLGRVRLRGLPCQILLGSADAPDLHFARSVDRLLDDRGKSRETLGTAVHAECNTGVRAGRSAHHGGQGLQRVPG